LSVPICVMRDGHCLQISRSTSLNTMFRLSRHRVKV
jgi:hypothetical protein